MTVGEIRDRGVRGGCGHVVMLAMKSETHDSQNLTVFCFCFCFFKTKQNLAQYFLIHKFSYQQKKPNKKNEQAKKHWLCCISAKHFICIMSTGSSLPTPPSTCTNFAAFCFSLHNCLKVNNVITSSSQRLVFIMALLCSYKITPKKWFTTISIQCFIRI